VGLGPLSESARPYAAEHGIEVWQAAELARALSGISLEVPRDR
jgi:restriction system protein